MAAAGDKYNGFTLVRQLGAGGMGETWEAVRVVGANFEQRVAIKVADRDSLVSPEGLELFRREASLAASLRHPNIAAVLDVDERLGCIVCELVDGADFRAVLRASARGILSAPVMVHILGQVARGLSHAHRRVLHGELSPVVHRDMSPGNIVLDYDGNLKIVDFGIAKAIASADISETIKGKLSYMAPEQAMGTRVDGRVDQYAVGVMAYEALCGVRPNDGAHDGETLANILSGKHVPLAQRGRDLPPGLAEVIERMLSVNPDQRFPSMDGVITALDPFTPPLTVHRELADLVLRARPAQTIVLQNGVFVSKPVAQESLMREPTPKGRARARSDSGSVQAPSSRPGDRYPKRDPSAHTHTQPARSAPPPLPVPVRDDDAELRHMTSRGPSGRWQATFAALGAVVLGALSWFVFSADTHTTTTQKPPSTPIENKPPSLGPSLPPSSTLSQPPSTPAPPPPTAATTPPTSLAGASDLTRTQPRSDSSGEETKLAANDRPRRSKEKDKEKEKEKDRDKEKEKDAQASAQTKPTRGGALARVKVFPWGRVWVDGKLEGSVPPILEVNLPPGTHEIAVGHEQPLERRNVNFGPGTTLVSFDLESK
ncbi:MAG TPA: serine/threonine-protein kinase [Polyangiales bacterium]|nr:serine/threonine-protein kinase [Polyangiales bacterium]